MLPYFPQTVHSADFPWIHKPAGTTKNGQICAPAQNPGFPYPPELSISCPFLPFLSAADGTILHPSRSADSLFLFFHDHTHICPDSGYHCRTFLPGFHPHCRVSSENLPADVPHCTHGSHRRLRYRGAGHRNALPAPATAHFPHNNASLFQNPLCRFSVCDPYHQE